MVEADLFDKLEAVARSVNALSAGFWWFSVWNLPAPAPKVPRTPLQSCPAAGQAIWRDPAHHLWGLPAAATCNQGLPAPEVLLSGITHPLALPPRVSALLLETPTLSPPGQELEKVCPSHPGADRGAEAGRPDLHLSAAGCQAGKVGSGEQRRDHGMRIQAWVMEEHRDPEKEEKCFMAP